MNVNVITKTNCLGREEWLKFRTMGIGGSDVSVIAGVNPYRSVYQLWLEKTGQIMPQETDNEYTHFGTLLEPLVKKEFTQRTGLKVRAKRMLLQNKQYPFMIANLDGVVKDNGETYIFEAKTVSAFKQEEWNDKIPYEYMLQIQHYMAVTGLKRAYIAALIGGNHFVYHVVERDDEMITDIIAMERKFWEENVLGGAAPVADGSEATTTYLNKKYSESNAQTIDLPKEVISICEEYNTISDEIEMLSAEKDALSNHIKSLLQNNEVGVAGRFRVSWKQVNSARFDSSRFKAENPELYGMYVKYSRYRRFGITGGGT